MQRRYDRDPYKILDVRANASLDEIKRAYHKLARQFHPDLNKDPRAAERMKDINWAKDILADPQERFIYDQWKKFQSHANGFGGSYSSYRGASNPRSSARANATPKSTNWYASSEADKRAQGCSSPGLALTLFIILMNLVRLARPAPQQINNFPVVNFGTQTAVMERFASSLDTIHATQTSIVIAQPDTPFPTPSPSAAFLGYALEDEDLRSEIVPGSWIWEQIHLHFPELATSTGLDDETLRVAYDGKITYRIFTRTLGEYWLIADTSNDSTIPLHFPSNPTVTQTP
ncbi:MAG: DnaJ domain-containing protein [Anaerolineales bacterium]|nr:DnaJ domain-containing protein [Anaerolineales bacterium]